jgi:hypothetical protein
VEWNERYELEKMLQQILIDEEIQWQRRGGEKWILAGDSNSSFFTQMCQWQKKKNENNLDGSEWSRDNRSPMPKSSHYILLQTIVWKC